MDHDQAMKLFEEHKDLAVPYARSFFPLVAFYPGVTVEDMEQEALIAVWKAAQRYDPERGMKFSSVAWMYVRDAFTKKQLYWSRQQRHADRFCFSLDAPIPYTDDLALRDVLPSTMDTEADCLAHLTLQGKLTKLNDRQQECLRYLADGYTHQEIARIIGCSRSRVGQIIRAVSKKVVSL